MLSGLQFDEMNAVLSVGTPAGPGQGASLVDALRLALVGSPSSYLSGSLRPYGFGAGDWSCLEHAH